MKPISTTLTPLPSVDLAAGEAAQTAYERSDFCAVPRAAVVGEAMMAFVLADALLEMVGGDRVDLVADRVAALPTARLADLPMDAAPWRFDSPSGAGPVPSDAPAAGPDSSDAPTGERDAPVDGGPGAPSRKPPSRGPRTDISPDARARDG
jgi:hypothetical protein